MTTNYRDGDALSALREAQQLIADMRHSTTCTCYRDTELDRAISLIDDLIMGRT